MEKLVKKNIFGSQGILNSKVLLTKITQMGKQVAGALNTLDKNPSVEFTKKLVMDNIKGFRIATPDVPKAMHSIRVYEMLKEHGFSEEVQLAGLLHDIIEDSDITVEELKRHGYSQRVIDLVLLCTHDESLGDNADIWKTKMEKIIKVGDIDAWAIIIADASDNLNDMFLQNKRDKRTDFLIRKPPVFMYYGNQYFGGTKFFDLMIERYFAQIKHYHGYFQDL